MLDYSMVFKGIEHVIFDFDGTLFDTGGDIIECLDKAYSQMGIDVSLHEIVIGPPLKEMINLLTPGLDKDKVDCIISIFRKCYSTCGFNKTYPIEGAVDLLDDLVGRGIKVFVATNKPHQLCRTILEKFGLDGMFNEIIAVDSKGGLTKSGMIEYLIGKWGMAKDRTLMVGDTVNDIVAAKDSKIKVVAITSGYGKYHEIVEAGPDFVVDNINGLREIISI